MSGNVHLFLRTIAAMAILLGMAISGLRMTTTRAVVIVAAGWLLFDVPFSLSYWALLTLTFALTMAAVYGRGMLFASLFLLFGREAWHMFHLAVTNGLVCGRKSAACK